MGHAAMPWKESHFGKVKETHDTPFDYLWFLFINRFKKTINLSLGFELNNFAIVVPSILLIIFLN